MGHGTRHLQHVTSQYMFFQYMFVWLIVQPCRFQLAAMLEMPEDSAPFKAVEQSMEKHGLADTNWDETDPVQKAYSLAKLKRWDLSEVHATFTSTANGKKAWQQAKRATAKHSWPVCPACWKAQSAAAACKLRAVRAQMLKRSMQATRTFV